MLSRFSGRSAKGHSGRSKISEASPPPAMTFSLLCRRRMYPPLCLWHGHRLTSMTYRSSHMLSYMYGASNRHNDAIRRTENVCEARQILEQDLCTAP
jgi:hypothetical protein